MSPLSYLTLVGQASNSAVSEVALGNGPVESEIFAMIMTAGPMVKAIMMALLLASVISWAIILIKFLQFSKASSQSSKFLSKFWKSRTFATLYQESSEFSSSPVGEVFRVGYQELGRVYKAKMDASSALVNVQRALSRTATSESTRLFKFLPFLASCGNATPFIGLFGTVWGIMGSFHEIGLKGSANLANVAPGISEALVATAAGLAAAIPAVIFFNYFNGRLRIMENEISNFMNDFLNILERDLVRKPPSLQTGGDF
ncbi:MAG: protein TolQ [Deltaproteobacteria bacterium]|jgi:biopolymer transport protein TolQ|nr:protein TolQ [Deltaproteobacteria bacterium]